MADFTFPLMRSDFSLNTESRSNTVESTPPASPARTMFT